MPVARDAVRVAPPVPDVVNAIARDTVADRDGTAFVAVGVVALRVVTDDDVFATGVRDGVALRVETDDDSDASDDVTVRCADGKMREGVTASSAIPGKIPHKIKNSPLAIRFIMR